MRGQLLGRLARKNRREMRSAMRPAKPIPVHEARAIAEKYAYDQVIIFARKVGDDGMEHLTTYGRDEVHCGIAARVGDFLKHKVMGWVREDTTVHEDHRERHEAD
jgi:hypothetical protein